MKRKKNKKWKCHDFFFISIVLILFFTFMFASCDSHVRAKLICLLSLSLMRTMMGKLYFFTTQFNRTLRALIVPLRLHYALDYPFRVFFFNCCCCFLIILFRLFPSTFFLSLSLSLQSFIYIYIYIYLLTEKRDGFLFSSGLCVYLSLIENRLISWNSFLFF